MGILIPATVVGRVGPWLQRMGPSAWSSAQEALSKAGIVGLKSAGELVTYVRNNKATTTTVLSSLAGAGFAVSDLFSPTDKGDPEVRQFVAELAQQEISSMRERISAVASSSEALAGVGHDKNDLRLLEQVTKWAIAHYGSKSNARNAFDMHQAFFELSKEDLDIGLELLT